MTTIRKDLMSYAASGRNPPKGYGSIDKGLEVMAYRTSREAFHKANGVDWIEAIRLGESDAILKYGEPFYSVDEDGIPI